jgi:hypothetical protein
MLMEYFVLRVYIKRSQDGVFGFETSKDYFI